MACPDCLLRHGTHYIPLPLEPLMEPLHAALVHCGSFMEQCDAFACIECVGGPEMPACADCGTAFCASCAAEGALCRPTRSYDTDARDEVFCRSCLEARGLPAAASDDDDEGAAAAGRLVSFSFKATEGARVGTSLVNILPNRVQNRGSNPTG